MMAPKAPGATMVDRAALEGDSDGAAVEVVDAPDEVGVPDWVCVPEEVGDSVADSEADAEPVEDEPPEPPRHEELEPS